jgi:phosphate transport system substrate-binding protein
VLVTGISGDKNSIGFFGYAYYENNKEKLKLVPIVNPKTAKAVEPSLETVRNGAYSPLSRPLFLYVAVKSADKPEVKAYIDYYIAHAAKLSEQVGYIALPAPVYEKLGVRFSGKTTGSSFQGGHEGKPLDQIF